MENFVSVPPEPNGACHDVAAGSAYEIPAGVAHMLRNKSSGYLEHLVFALPPFNPNDVYLRDQKLSPGKTYPLSLPEAEDCFDGAKILSYAFSRPDLSIAYGWVMNDPARRKQPHRHKKSTEFVYVVEGKGFIEIDRVRHPLESGDWIRIDPETEHGLFNEAPEDLVVVCICSPAFQMEDVRHR